MAAGKAGGTTIVIKSKDSKIISDVGTPLINFVIIVVKTPIIAIKARSSTNLYESFSKRKSTGGGYNILLTRPPVPKNK